MSKTKLRPKMNDEKLKLRGAKKLLSRSLPASGDCVVYSGYRNELGYGRFRFMRSKWLAHRLSYLIFVGDIPSEMNVLHRCDNPSCINPWHLYLGTAADNARDMAERERQWLQRAKKQGLSISTSKHRFSDDYRRAYDDQA